MNNCICLLTGVCVVGPFRVRLVERGAPQSLPLMESGKVRCSICIPVVSIQFVKCLVKDMLTMYSSGPLHFLLFSDTARCAGDHRKSRDKRPTW